MFDDALRRLKDRLLAPVARLLGARVSPSAITWLAGMAGAGSAAAALAGANAPGLALWVLNRLLDGLDGTHARVHGRQSAFGAYLDIVLDFIVYAAIPVALSIQDGSPAVLRAAVLLIASFYVNAASWMYLAALLGQRQQGAASHGDLTSVIMPAGLVAGTETVVAYSLFFLVPSRLPLLFSAMAGLVLVNVVMRLVWAARRLE